MDVNLEIRTRSKLILQQELGTLRSFASELAHKDSSLDEEALFDIFCQNWLLGLKRELTKIIGSERSTEYLNPFNGITTKS